MTLVLTLPKKVIIRKQRIKNCYAEKKNKNELCFGRTSFPVRHPVRPLWWPSNQHFFTSFFKDEDEDIVDDDEDIADEDEVEVLKPAFLRC